MWYVATIMVQCRVGNQQPGPWTVQEQIHLVEAADEDKAYEKALEIGKREDLSYQNADGETVRWEFIGLDDLEWTTDEPIQDGAEIRTRFLESSDPASLTSPRSSLVVFKSRRTDSQEDA